MNNGFLMGVGRFDIGAAGAPPAGVVGTFRTFVSSETDSATYSFAGIDIGAASADRMLWIVPVSQSAASQTLTTVTANGITATMVVDNGSASRQIYAYEVAVPSGTTVTIDLTYNAAMARAGVMVWTITNTTQTTYSQRSGTNVTTATGNSLQTPAITVPTNGFAVSAVIINSTSSPVTWTQTTGTGTKVADGIVGTTPALWASGWQSTEAGSQQYTADGVDGVLYRMFSIAIGP